MRRLRPLVPFALLSLLAACGGPPPAPPSPPAATRTPALEHINLTADWPYPFSSAVRAGDLIFLSGQLGTKNESGGPKVVPGGIEAETRQALENIKEILDRSGSSMDHVLKCMVMLADMNEWPAMNKVYASYFPGPKPARTSWGVTGLALGGRVEMTCIAVVRRS
jgi:2-iminobutanoate/2-iminopropanoate deaminase